MDSHQPDETYNFQGLGNNVSERQGRRDLSELEELQLILRKGSGPATHYIRT